MGAPFSELTVPQFAIPIPFTFYTISLMLLTKHVVQMRHFQMSNGVSPETHFQDKGKPSHEVWLLQAITHDIPVVCTPGTFIKVGLYYQTMIDCLAI